ncbi:hypothetical protein ACRASX_14815 [Flavobacterium sp. TMP13]|uniref:hypothetical protein n=1 Tax=unclassified Flavobacterium TaxID=196869 RepID=UPI00076DB602|nr:hypothetical protein [Flavobacterium sp. TAB 87]KVV16199.1 hypothetical protein AP058_00257 [Flavobacterium sp. TAB 87]
MNQKNFEFLRDQIKFTGFGEGLENALQQKIKEGTPTFQLEHSGKFNNDQVSTSLQFKKSEQTDMYFFNSYKVDLQKEGGGAALSQNFYINKENNITLKEAYNLMDGRAVNKDLKNAEGQVYNSWLKMDFKESDASGNFKMQQYHQNYGYDLEATLAKHPIKELETPNYKDSLLASLKKGNMQSVTFKINGEEVKQFVEANPHFKTVNVYDDSMKRISTREVKDQKQGEGQKEQSVKDLKKDKKEENVTALDESSKKKPRKKQSKAI